MTRTHTTLCFLCGALLLCAAAAPAQYWLRSYELGATDHARSIQATPDGGHLLGGQTIQRTDAGGAPVYAKTFPQEVEILASTPTQDGGVAVAGALDHVAWAARLDPDGTIRWQGSFAPSEPVFSDFGSIAPTIDGGFFLVGSAPSTVLDQINYTVWALRIDGDGNILWERAWGWWVSEGTQRGYLGRESSDGSFFVAGHWADHWNRDGVWLLKLDPAGDLLWQSVLRLPAGELAPQKLVATSDGGCAVVAGWPVSVFLVAKIDQAGLLSWARRVVGTPSVPLAAVINIAETTDQGLLVGGAIPRDSTLPADALLVKMDSGGSVVWSQAFGDTILQELTAVAEEPGVGYVAAGVSGGGSWLLRTDLLGDIPSHCCLQWDPATTVQGVTLESVEPLAERQYPMTTRIVTSITLRDVTATMNELCPQSTPAAPPRAVSAVALGDRPLLPLPRGGGILLEPRPEANAYNLYECPLGETYTFPPSYKEVSSECSITDWTDNPDGTITIDRVPTANTWFLVTASNGCGEGPAGPNSEGFERTTIEDGNWPLCGLAP